MKCSAVTEDEERKLGECKFQFSTISTIPTPAPKSSKVIQDDEKEAEDGRKGDAEAEEEEAEDRTTEDEPKEKNDVTKPKMIDPIRMFGILVPPALRSAQNSFIEAVDGPITRLAAVTGELRALEREIGRARKAVRKA
jgi:hypothetical protein